MAEKSPWRSAREGTVEDFVSSLAVVEPFVICEEKSLVFADRPTKSPAELVLLQGLGLGREIVRGVKNIVAEEIPRALRGIGWYRSG